MLRIPKTYVYLRQVKSAFSCNVKHNFESHSQTLKEGSAPDNHHTLIEILTLSHFACLAVSHIPESTLKGECKEEETKAPERGALKDEVSEWDITLRYETYS